MFKSKKILLFLFCIIAVNLFFTTVLSAQASEDNIEFNTTGESGDPVPLSGSDPGDNPDIPVDGGICLLLAAGVALGVKKVHNKRLVNSISKDDKYN